MATHKDIKSLTPAEVREMSAHFDDHIRNGLSINEQVSFLMTYSRNFENWQNREPGSANPSVVVFKSSLLVHRLFLPENLASFTDETVVRLYRLAVAANIFDVARPSFTMMSRIIVGTLSLKPAVRALFAHYLMRPCDLYTVMPSDDPLFHARTIAAEHEAQSERRELFISSNIATLQGFRKPDWMNGVDSIVNGNTTAFRLGCSIAGKRITRNVIISLLMDSPQIVSDLIREIETFERIIPFKDLTLYAIYHSEPTVAITILSAIATKKPQLLSSLVDEFGNNLLWHRLYHDRRGNRAINYDNSEEIELCNFLMSFGVEPDHENCYQLAWRDVMDARELLKKYS